MIRYLTSFFLFHTFLVLQGDVGKFLEPITFGKNTETPYQTKQFLKSSALISPTRSIDFREAQYTSKSSVKLDRELLELKLSEMIAHRYQASGKVSVFLTREWNNLEIGSNFIVKINDCTPDELTSSTFIRFSIWDEGSLIGNFAEPVRMAHYVDVYFTSLQLNRGSRINPSMCSSRPVDILKQFAGAVPVTANLNGYQLSANLKPNSPVRWNQLAKVTLVRKGKVVDVFASGNGIYVTMKGMALEDGVEGGLVKIKNLSSDKTFHAKVLNENSVKVHL